MSDPLTDAREPKRFRARRINRWLLTYAALVSLALAMVSREPFFILQTFVITVLATLKWSLQ